MRVFILKILVKAILLVIFAKSRTNLFMSLYMLGMEFIRMDLRRNLVCSKISFSARAVNTRFNADNSILQG